MFVFIIDIRGQFCKNIKIIVSCRTQVFQDVTFQSLKLFVSCEYSLVSEKLSLTVSEKMSIAKLYLGEKAGSVSDKIDYFPLLCRLFKEKTDIDTEDFFQNPYETYKNELDELWNDRDGGRYKVCALLLCILYNNRSINSNTNVLLLSIVSKIQHKI